MRLERQRAILRPQHQEGGGGIGDVGHRLRHALSQRQGVVAGAAYRIAESHPFGAVIIAVLEEMLGHLPLPEGAQPADRKSTRLNSSHKCASRMPSSA